MSIPLLGNQIIQFDPRASIQTDPHVSAVQQALNAIAGESLLQESGVFDRATQEAVENFQRQHHLPPTGTIDQRTLDAIDHNRTSQTQQQSPAPALTPQDRNRRTMEFQSQEQLQRNRLEQQLQSPGNGTQNVNQHQQVAESTAESLRMRLDPSERSSFDRIEAANNEAESHGAFVNSRLGTTAGEPASRGRGQILVRDQIRATREGLTNRTNPELQQTLSQLTSVTPGALNQMNNRGNAAMAWYDLTASNRGVDAQTVQNSGLSQQQTTQLRELASQGRSQEILNNPDFVRTFETTTGLPRTELQTMLDSRGLNTNAYQNEYREAHTRMRPHQREYTREIRQTQQDLMGEFRTGLTEHRSERTQAARRNQTIDEMGQRHQEIQQVLTGNPTLRNQPERLFREVAALRTLRNPAHPELNSIPVEPGRMLRQLVPAGEASENNIASGLVRHAAAAEITARHPDLQSLLNAHPEASNRIRLGDIAAYSEHGRVNENRNGWYAQGASTVAGWDQFTEDLPNIDLVTNRQRSIENFTRARGITAHISGFQTLSQSEQDRITGQIAR
ncbi:MAG TPA: peptidoglycan-binding domain-containing protein, partial [Acidobacteriota bacterium]|nr:peptidoglycan-binding domain-containing protein [Acidobacteriota bacterium]